MDAAIVYGCLTPHPPVLVPAVGGRRSGQLKRTLEAMGQVAGDILDARPDALLLISPHAPIDPYSMGVSLADRYVGNLDAFGAPRVRFSAGGDVELAHAIQDACAAHHVPAYAMARSGSYVLDHGAMVPLYFLDDAGVRCPIVLLNFSALPVGIHRAFGEAILAAVGASGKRVVLVASGDMSHRLFPGAPAGYDPSGKQFDEAMALALRTGDRDAVYSMDAEMRERAGECGYRSVVIALAAMPGATTEVLSYEGPFGVGYLVARFVRQGPNETFKVSETSKVLTADETAALGLAKEAVETYVQKGRLTRTPEHPTGLLAEGAGAFVCLKIDGELRGCMGTFQPSEPNLAEEIVRNAVAAASRDPRFPPVSASELPRLSYSVDILSEPEPVQDESSLDPKRYGVIVQAGFRRGLLLPDLDEVTSVLQQVDIAKRKAGIGPNEKVKLSRFTVRRISE